MSPMYSACSTAGGSGYQYGYPGQANGSGHGSTAYPRDQYGAQYQGYPGYPGYDPQAQGAQGYPAAYQGYKSQGYAEGGYGAYYYNCPSAPSEGGPASSHHGSSASSNTPLPPDFSYVGNSHGPAAPPDSSYSDFYAMG
jgi:hypothetical protein